MSQVTLAVVAVLTAVSGWHNNFYAFAFGCAALVASSVLFAADGIVREVRLTRRAAALYSERTGLQVATAINAAASTSYRQKRGA